MLAWKELPSPARPCLVLAHADPLYAALIRQIFLRLRWDVYVTSSGTKARELAAELAPALVVLDTGLPDESGWLACAKITQENAARRVILLAADRSPETAYRLASVNAAALVTRHEDIEVLAETILGQRLAQAI